LQGTQNLHTKANLAKEPALSYTRQASFGATQTHILDDREDRVCVQQAVWQYGGATNIFSTFYSLISFSSSRRITPSNRINNELLFINLAAVTG